MKLLLSLLFCTTILAAQDTLNIAEVDQASQLPPGSVKIEKGRTDDATTRFLTSIYSNIRYPRSTRDAGLTGAVKVLAFVNADGRLTVDSLQFLPFINHKELDVPESSEIIFTAYGWHHSNGGTIKKMTPEQLAKNAKKVDIAKNDLLEEVQRVLKLLPEFTPATHEGKTVAMEWPLYFFFQMK